VLGRSGDQVAVDGLSAGDTVVVEAGYGLPDGTTVKVDQGEKGEKEEKGTGAKGEEAEKGAEASR
jgi:hypothetical protein